MSLLDKVLDKIYGGGAIARRKWWVKVYYGGGGVEVYPVRTGNHPVKGWPKDLENGGLSSYDLHYPDSREGICHSIERCQGWCDRENTDERLDWWDHVRQYH